MSDQAHGLCAEYYTGEGQPIKCPHCDSTEITCRHFISDGIPCEAEYECAACKKNVGFWSFGSYDTGYVADCENLMLGKGSAGSQ